MEPSEESEESDYVYESDENLIKVDLANNKIDILEEVPLIIENDLMSETILIFKNALMLTIEELHSTITFLKNELEERNLHIRTLLLKDANDGRSIEMSLLEKSKTAVVIETSPMLNSTLNHPSVISPEINDTQNTRIMQNDNTLEIKNDQESNTMNDNDSVFESNSKVSIKSEFELNHSRRYNENSLESSIKETTTSVSFISSIDNETLSSSLKTIDNYTISIHSNQNSDKNSTANDIITEDNINEALLNPDITQFNNDNQKAKHLEEELRDVRIFMHLKYLDNCKQDDIIEIQPPLSDTPNLPENNQFTLFETKNNFNILRDYALYDDVSENIDFDDYDVLIPTENLPQPRDELYKGKNKKRSTVIISDSLTRDIKGKKLAERVNNQKVYVKTYGGAKVGDMKYHAIPSMEYQPNHVILHVGTNEVRTRITAEDIASHIIDIGNTLKDDNNDVTISGLVYRKNTDDNTKIDDINNNLKILCRERNFLFLDNSNIPPRFLRDGVHLNKAGNDVFFNNLLTCIRY